MESFENLGTYKRKNEELTLTSKKNRFIKFDILLKRKTWQRRFLVFSFKTDCIGYVLSLSLVDNRHKQCKN